MNNYTSNPSNTGTSTTSSGDTRGRTGTESPARYDGGSRNDSSSPNETSRNETSRNESSRSDQHKNDHKEGPIARTIEKETAKIPSDAFLFLAGGAVLASCVLRMLNKRSASDFVATWVPTVLICGVYNKIVKTHGHDAATRHGDDAEVAGG